MVYSGAWGKLIHGKKPEVENLVSFVPLWCRMQKIKPPDPQNLNCNCTRNTYLSNYLFTTGFYEHLPHVAVENKQKYKGELNVRFVRTEHIVNLVLKENIY